MNQLKGRVSVVYRSQSITEGNKGRNSRQNSGDRNLFRGHGEILFMDLVSMTR